jgi:hypothetical protein
MYFLRARYYRPLIGQFLTADTYEGTRVEPKTQHHDAYASSDPVNRIDPTGHANLVTWSMRAGVLGPLYVQAQKLGEMARGLASLGEYAAPELARVAEEITFLLEERNAVIEEGIDWFESQPGRVTSAVSQLQNAKTGEIIQTVAMSGKHLTGRMIDLIIAPFEVHHGLLGPCGGTNN